MSEDKKMDCFSDEQKTKNIDIELKDDHRMEEQNIDMELKTSIEDDTESFGDPLQEQATISSNFTWLFKDEDILSNDELDNVVLKPGINRSKRGRPLSNGSSSISSSMGHAWSVEGPALHAAQAELLLPKHVACGKGPARNISNAVEAWILLFDDEMLRLLQSLLNTQIRQRRSRTHAERLTDLTELRSWLGLCYLCGVFRNAQHNGPLDELWTVELGNAIFRATMSLARFEFLADCLSVQCDSNLNDEQRLWQKLLINCRSYYGPSGWLSVDEQPALNNASVLLLCCDAKTLYMTNAVLSKRETTASKELMQLICDYKTTGRNITLGTRYASLKHAQQLHSHNLSSICTLNVTSPDYPKNWTGNTLYSGVKRLTQQGGVSLLTSGLSTQVHALRVHRHTSQSCEQFRELLTRYSTTLSLPARLALAQPSPLLQLLHLMLNVAAINAWVLLRLSPKGDAHIEQRDFQRQLGLFLTQQRLQRRLHRRSTSTTLMMRLQICEILGQSSQRLLSEAASDAKQTQGVGLLSLDHAKLPEGVALVSRYGEKHRRCKPCARNKRETKARSRCQQCQTHRCGNHLISRCYECMGLTTAQVPEGNIKDC